MKVVDVWGCAHEAAVYNKSTMEAKFNCIENDPDASDAARMYPWHRAFIPGPNCTVKVSKNCKFCYPDES